MRWIDSTLGTAARGLSQQELRMLAGELAELGASVYEVAYSDLETVLQAGVAPAQLRVLAPAEPAAILAIGGAGVKAVRLEDHNRSAQQLAGVWQGAAQNEIQLTATWEWHGEMGDGKTTAGADGQSRLFIDRQGRADPLDWADWLPERTKGGVFEFWGGNQCGLGTANALAAMRSGADGILAAVAGVDGGAPWEEVFVAWNLLEKKGGVLPPELVPRCRRILGLLGRPVPLNKPLLGSNIFAHESGIHVDGVLKNPVLYEPFPPELVGQRRSLILGTHSGRAAVAQQLSHLGLPWDRGCLEVLVQAVQQLARRQGAGLAAGQLVRLYRQEEWICESTG